MIEQCQPGTSALRPALEALAKINLWRDTYPDGPDIFSDPKLSRYFTVEQVRTARAALIPDVPQFTGEAVAPANPNELRDALDAIEAQLHEMRSLKGWRLNLIRENLARAKAALSSEAIGRDATNHLAKTFNPLDAGFSLVDDGRICRDDDPDCRHPDCDCARYVNEQRASTVSRPHHSSPEK